LYLAQLAAKSCNRTFIDADDTRHSGIGLASTTSLEVPQDCGVADWHAETGHQPLGRPTTRAVAKQSDDPSQTGGLSCERGSQPRMPLGENPAVASIIPASPARRPHVYRDRFSLSGEIPQRSLVRAVTRTR
jgi:hypothetical protein